MSLVNPSQAMVQAYASNRALGAFNVDSLDMQAGVIDGALAAKYPIIIQVTADTLDLWGWTRFTGLLRKQAEDAEVLVGLHLDHSTRIEDIARAIDLGFTSVMYDGSILPVDENIQNTREVVALAHRHGVMVEAELGHVSRSGEPPEWEAVTTPKEAQDFFEGTEVDSLAVAIGTRHGKSTQPESVNFEALEKIKAAIPCPLVLHGASGVPDALLGKIIALGVSKVNIGTELRRIWWRSIDQARSSKTRVALHEASQGIAHYVEHKIRVLAGA